MIKHVFAFFFGSVMLLFIFACNTNKDFTIGEELVNTKTNILSIDTCTIWSSTVKIDSVRTSGSGKALIGSFTEPIDIKNLETSTESNIDLGTIKADTYFEMALPTSTVSIDNEAVYESLTLSMKFSHDYYGDTTKSFTVEAYRINRKKDILGVSDILGITGFLYNTSRFTTSEFLGSKTVMPRPSRNDSVYITLSDDLGQDLFGKIKRQDDSITDQTKFIKYFKGFALKAPDAKAILGFNVADTSLFMRLHYHIGGVKYSLNFNVHQITGTNGNTYAQFNHVEVNRPLSPLDASLKKLENSVYSSRTKNQTYCQGSTGLMTKLEFPYLSKLLQVGSNIKILKAELILCPVKGSYKTIRLPNYLYLNYTDNLNTIGSFLSNGQSILTPVLTLDEQYGEQTQYSFDLTSFITSAVNQTTTSIPALEVSISSDLNYTTLKRVVLGDGIRGVNTAKLKILYWRY